MKLGTHLHLANIILSAYEQELNKFFFKMGNTLPDLLPNMRFRLHTEQHSTDFVYKRINKLLKRKHLSRYVLSVKLGIISHFLSDFCCAPHKSNYTGSLIDHRKHEVNLTNYHGKYHEEFVASVENAKSVINHVLSARVAEVVKPYKIIVVQTQVIQNKSVA